MLLLAPTRFELEALLGPVPGLGPGCVPVPSARGVRVGLVGFGPIAAGIAAARHFAAERPRHALLVGIAGSNDLALAPLASVHRAAVVTCHGVGAGEGREHLSARRLGFEQMPPELAGTQLGERLALVPPPSPLDELPEVELLSACSASASAAEAAERRRLHPYARLEDLEGFAVAMAAAVSGVALSIVRSVSNLTGDRDKSHWELHAALAALRGELARWLTVAAAR